MILQYMPYDYEYEFHLTATLIIFFFSFFNFFVSEDEFQTMQNNFLDKYYSEFEDSEENKFVYTDIHKEYVSNVKYNCSVMRYTPRI